MVRALNTIHLPGLLVAVPVRAAVAMTGYMNNGKNYAHNGREIYADKNIVENHIDRLSVMIPTGAGAMLPEADVGLSPNIIARLLLIIS